jgi:hypothetical protein
MLGWTRIFTLVAVAAVVAVVTGGAGATSTSTPAPGTASRAMTAAASRGALLRTANLNTLAGAARYLRAIGVDPRGLVIQQGARNYAGSSCPGAGWACTSTAHPVIQIAAAGGKNTFLCSTGSCAVVQTTAAAATRTTSSLAAATATNTAKCIKTTGLTQSCSISQNTSSGDNEAIVYENAFKNTGLTQTALVTAQITQTASGSNANKACVFQNVNIEGSSVEKKASPIVVSLNARQTISITQDSKTGGNTLASASTTSAGSCSGDRLLQTQTLLSKASGAGGSITQNENAGSSQPNVSLVIAQNQSAGYLNVASGANAAAFTQQNTLTAIASKPTGAQGVNQTQSSTSGGIQAIVNQFSLTQSTIDAIQTETQCEDALIPSAPLECGTTAPDTLPYPLSQVQHGPVRKDTGSTQAGNSASTFTIKQTSIQNNDTGGANQTNTVEGDCATSGSCTVTQDTNVNGTPAHNTQTGSSVDAQISCSGNDCTPTGGSATGTVSVSATGLVASNVDVREFGVGGMRGTDGTGSISVSGIASPVVAAFLYWNGPTNSTNPAANAAVTFNGTAVTGTNIGVASSNCWGFTNSQSYRADVTSLVTGNLTYSLANFVKTDVDINGVSLIVFYNDGTSSNDRNVVLWNGNDSNIASTGDPADWDETLTGVSYPGSGAAFLDFVVADGQQANDGALTLNGQATPLVPAGAIFEGASPVGNPNYIQPATPGSLWDVRSFDMTSFLTPGANTLHLTSPFESDCLSLVAVAANVPAAAPIG